VTKKKGKKKKFHLLEFFASGAASVDKGSGAQR
jgi:hypothetical protein